MRARRRLLAAASAALVAAALPACDRIGNRRRVFHAGDITGAEMGADFRVPDHRGVPRGIADFRGRVVVLAFGYTHCPDMCPTTLADLATVVRSLGPDASRVQVLFLTVDPKRDSSELLAHYVPAFHPDFVGLRGDPEETARIAKAFKVFVSFVPGRTPETYTVDHSTQMLAFDGSGRIRLLIAHGTPPEKIAADLRLLLNG